MHKRRNMDTKSDTGYCMSSFWIEDMDGEGEETHVNGINVKISGHILKYFE
jgi:hypothetical protein